MSMTGVLARKWQLDRRTVLRGIGASVALPLMDCMSPPLRDDRNAVAPPKRCVFIYVPNGVNALTWQIQQSGADYTMPSPLASLEGHRASITPISGLHHPNGIGKAHECDKIWLTGARLTPSAPFRNSLSVDQAMANEIGHLTRFPSLELAITGGTLAWNADGNPLPAERKPGSVFERLFADHPGGVDSARNELTRRKSVLDKVLDSARDLRRSIGYDDRLKLDDYLNSVREVEQRTERADAWLSMPRPEVEMTTRDHLMREIPEANAGDYYRTMYDLMLLALQTDMTRVITCMTGNEGRGLALPEIGIRQSRHELSHHNGDPVLMQRLTQCDTFLTEQFAYFLDRLKKTQDGNENLLDRTMVLFGGGMCYGHGHGNANLPTILAGGTSLGLRHGQHLDFNLPVIGEYDLFDPLNHYRLCTRPVDGSARLNNLLLTLLRCMDIETAGFGDSVRPLDELLA